MIKLFSVKYCFNRRCKSKEPSDYENVCKTKTENNIAHRAQNNQRLPGQKAIENKIDCKNTTEYSGIPKSLPKALLRLAGYN